MASQKRRRKGRVLLPVLVLILASLALGWLGWRWYDENVDRSGWRTKEGLVSYYDFHGKPVSGWLELDGDRYFLDENAHPVYGWQQVDGIRRYFDAEGILQLGWLKLDDNYYYLPENENPAVGWQTILGKTYYFSQDGILCYGWQEIDGERYYLGENGQLAVGWLELEDGIRYLGTDGAMVTGTQLIEDAVYYFREDGIMHCGWLESPEGKRYYDETGAMVTGWLELDGKRYYLDEDGLTCTGWLQQGEYRYYLTEDGSAATSPTEIDGQMCYFSPKGIYVLLVNYRNGVPKNYDADLVRYGTSWSQVSKIALEPLQKMLADCKAAGINVWLNCAYRSYSEQVQILEQRTQENMDKGKSFEEARAIALETVAVPGYSEHQIGLAMDIVCSVQTEWLINHCWEYGFILRYPENKSSITHIVYEHWHFRYVGTEVSMDMKDTGLCLEEYLGAA